MSLANPPRFSVKGIQEHEDAQIEPSPVNVGQVERYASAITGALLVAEGLRRRTLPGAALALIGSGLIYRGVTGQCSAYKALKIDTTGKGEGHAEHVHKGRLIKHSTIVERPAQELYDYWRDVERAPTFMGNIERVVRTGPDKSHWVSQGPLGKTFEWDSEVINDEPGHLIAWKSLPGSDVNQAGAVRFEPATGGRGTLVTVEINYEPPAGALGVAIAKLIGQDPDALTKENLRRFKQLMEAGEIPTIEGQASGRGRD